MTVRVYGADVRAWQILELLDAHRAVTDIEREHRTQMLELLATTTDPLARTQYEPGHFTASALVISRSHGQVLLIHHPVLQCWLQPGGHLEPGDASPRAGALREVLEETGLAAQIDDRLFDVDIHDIPARGPTPRHQHFDLRFLATVDGLPAPASAEGVQARWFSPNDAMRCTPDVSVHRMIAKAAMGG